MVQPRRMPKILALYLMIFAYGPLAHATTWLGSPMNLSLNECNTILGELFHTEQLSTLKIILNHQPDAIKKFSSVMRAFSSQHKSGALYNPTLAAAELSKLKSYGLLTEVDGALELDVEIAEIKARESINFGGLSVDEYNDFFDALTQASMSTDVKLVSSFEKFEKSYYSNLNSGTFEERSYLAGLNSDGTIKQILPPELATLYVAAKMSYSMSIGSLAQEFEKSLYNIYASLVLLNKEILSIPSKSTDYSLASINILVKLSLHYKNVTKRYWEVSEKYFGSFPSPDFPKATRVKDRIAQIKKATFYPSELETKVYTALRQTLSGNMSSDFWKEIDQVRR
jgi:hypothetical protein